MSKILYISHSQIDLWQNCPKRWGYRYIDNIPYPVSSYLVEGSCYHKTLENNFKYKLRTGQDLPLTDISDALATNWNKLMVDNKNNIDWKGFDEDHVYEECCALVIEYMMSTAKSVIPTLVEETYLTDIDGTKFACIVDLIDDKGTVIDHKTSSKKYNQDDVDNDMQATAEAFSLGKAIMFQNHVAVKQSCTIQIMKSYRTDKDIAWWLNMAKGIIAHMNTGYFPPRCIKEDYRASEKWCPYWTICKKDLARTYR